MNKQKRSKLLAQTNILLLEAARWISENYEYILHCSVDPQMGIALIVIKAIIDNRRWIRDLFKRE
jgi:hypothetical protein